MRQYSDNLSKIIIINSRNKISSAYTMYAVYRKIVTR